MDDYRKVVLLREFQLSNEKFNLTSFVSELLEIVQTCFSNGNYIRVREIFFYFIDVIASWVCNLLGS